MEGGKYNFAIDRGGTFTDVLCITPDRTVRTLKLLSVDPANYPDAPTEGIRRILQQETGRALTVDGLIDTGLIGWVRMGTTVATNALLERAGDPVALVVNRGFRDLLQIGNQARPNIFQLNIQKPANLYREVIEIDARLVPAQEASCQLGEASAGWRRLTGAADSTYLEMVPLDEQDLRSKLEEVRAAGINSLAIVLAHSYACPEHELCVGRIAQELGFQHVTLSHQAMPMCRLVARGFTACAEAYLTPHVERYLDGFRSGFRDQLRGADVLFMQSDGGLTRMEHFRGARAILSGPAGGVVGYAVTGMRDAGDDGPAAGPPPPLIGFDMGGTSTDVSRYAGTYEHVIESTTAGVTIQAPQLDINTVAAGGGSRLFFRSGLFVVGPESAGAHPGPTCYRKGGPLTVTDANLILGRLLPEYFPAIFGPNENEPLDYEATRAAFEELRMEINEHLASAGEEAGGGSGGPLSLEQVAMGFVRVANEAMCRPIRALTQARGYDTSRHVLACFGGAGGQHACSIARQLGMARVVMHKYAGILSAYGMALADVVYETQEPCGLELCPDNRAALKERLHALSARCVEQLEAQGFALADEGSISLEPYLHLRYEGTDCALMCAPDRVVENADHTVYGFGDFGRTFRDRYRSEFGFVLEGRRILVDDIRVRGCGRASLFTEPDIAEATGPIYPEKTTVAYFEEGSGQAPPGRLVTPVYDCAKLRYGHRVDGPAILIDRLSTIVIEPGSRALVTRRGDLTIEIGTGAAARPRVDERLDAVQLSIFNHRFMSIAEQMGRVLQRTSISTNIKERLDFSCALFGPDGGLVSNAPHIPVHLGAMQETVQYQLRRRGGTLKPGDVLLSNHPQAGGSHLPDLTVITPVFAPGEALPVFFVASRGHHADIGGITPGSMPPHSTSLAQEGAAFKSFLLVDGGVFQEEAIVARLTRPAPGVPGAAGTRNLSDNLSDLRAQIAANQKGIQLVSELIDAYGLSVVQAYMGHMQQNAELAVRDMLRTIAQEARERTGSAVLEAEQQMDDGTPIRLVVRIDERHGSAVCDFTGTGPEVSGNCNAPRAITLSALIYCLRCMVGHDVPLNQGCLAPIEVIIPPGSILDPSDGAAVVGGNVLTSQRVVDTVLAAFGTCAASQGCMNNVTIGDEGWGYYETVAGGSGAGPGWHGTGGVHTHMTNTRITDPEILELRYPIVLRRFTLREDGSGGAGQFRGGEGVHRELLFRKPMTLSVLTERRTLRPYGMAGGMPGKPGLNLLIRAGPRGQPGHRAVNIGGKTAVQVGPGDIFSMKTPGGGGYGVPLDDDDGPRPTLSDQQQQRQLAAAAAIVSVGSSKAFMERGSVYEYRMAQESV